MFNISKAVISKVSTNWLQNSVVTFILYPYLLITSVRGLTMSVCSTTKNQ